MQKYVAMVVPGVTNPHFRATRIVGNVAEDACARIVTCYRRSCYTHMPTAPAIPVVNVHIQELLDHVPGIRRAEAEAVHQARVAARRLREVLPLLTLTHPTTASILQSAARKITRQLGRVRELDIMGRQLDVLEARVPAAAEEIASVRRRVRQAQERRRRRAIKGLEALRIERLRPVSPSGGRLLSRLRPRATARTSHRALREQIGARAGDVVAALDHAAGVYFPKRLHVLRVTVKKLRYSVELAGSIALWRPPLLLRDLKRLQERLGTLHDLQVLLDELGKGGALRSRQQAALLNAVVAGDLAREYDDYIARADRLRAIGAACERFASRPAPAERRWPLRLAG
jgi:CHAD domain-containing protein